MPLNFAFANKSVTLIWSMLFGIVLFKETISVANVIGALIVLVGVLIMVTEKQKEVHIEDNSSVVPSPCATDEGEVSEDD